ncbi:MAG: hypothetical protein EKK41_05515 [Hyphomicrobiales bacterium]|nr:MAG: hypothetical protein EKK41_05515 [Hyphomicrobiales bacterium]
MAHRWLHPLHAFLLAGAAYFFVSGLLSDWAYFSTQEIQWKNFAMWLIMGGLICAGFASLWALVDVIRAAGDRGRRLVYLLLMLAAFILEFINELVHAKDAWASMPDGLILSVIAALLVIIAAGLGLSSRWVGR